MWGAPTHFDIFDPKPRLNTEDGKPLSAKCVGGDIDDVSGAVNTIASDQRERGELGTVMGSPFKFAQHGESGLWISELFPHLAKHADKLCVVRSMHTKGQAHGEAMQWLHTGHANLVRPSIGSWVSYGLGRENENLPSFVTVSPPRGHGGARHYGNAFLPAVRQGTPIGSAEVPIKDAVISNLSNPRLNREMQRKQLDLIQSLNRRHLSQATADPNIEGLIENYELAFRMQSSMPPVMDFSNETRETLDLYGIDSEPADNFGRQCLLARKLAERGVRYIQCLTHYTWDHHSKNNKGHRRESPTVDRPIAGLLEDLDRRGLLEDTLVLWGAEFGRTPTVQGKDGRDHHPNVFTMWMAGGGVRPGFTYGSTDDFGYLPVENPVHMHDLHATLLYALGLDHEKLTYRYAGRDFRLTDVYGNVVHDIIA